MRFTVAELWLFLYHHGVDADILSGV